MTGTVDHVVETALEQDEQVVTRLARLAVSGLVVLAELLLEDAVGVARLLLLLQLGAVLRLLDAGTTVHARGVRTTLERGVATDEVDAEAARLLGERSGVTGHDSDS
jgi:hypothetical protein